MSWRPPPTSYRAPSGGASSGTGGSLPPAAGAVPAGRVPPCCAWAPPSCARRSCGSVALLGGVNSSGGKEVVISPHSFLRCRFFLPAPAALPRKPACLVRRRLLQTYRRFWRGPYALLARAVVPGAGERVGISAGGRSAIAAS